mgnify:CR=1 FL=1
MLEGAPLNSTEQHLSVAELAFRNKDSQNRSGVLAENARGLAVQFLKMRKEILKLLDKGSQEAIVAKLRGMKICLVIIERRLDTDYFINMNDMFEGLLEDVQQERPEISRDSIFRHVEEEQSIEES